MPKYPEVKISILIPDITNKTIEEMIDNISDSENEVYVYYIDEISNEDKTNIAVVTDRELPDEEIMEYYMQIMVYHQALGETLTEEEIALRDKEVTSKWFNGNFNYWIMD